MQTDVCVVTPGQNLKVTSYFLCWNAETSLSLFSSNSFIHSTVCLTTSTEALLKGVFHIVRSSASFFDFQNRLFSLRSSSSSLPLFPRLLVTYIIPSIFRFITCPVSKQHATNPVILHSCNHIYRISLFLLLCNTSYLLTRSVRFIFFILFPEQHFRTFQLFLIYFNKFPIFSTAQP